MEEKTEIKKDEPTKEELLEKYAEEGRDIHEFVQLDGWKDEHGLPPWSASDEDGDFICSSHTHEIRASPQELAVRVFVHVGTTREETVRLLEKILKWVRNNGGGWNFETGDEAMETSSRGGDSE